MKSLRRGAARDGTARHGSNDGGAEGTHQWWSERKDDVVVGFGGGGGGRREEKIGGSVV